MTGRRRDETLEDFLDAVACRDPGQSAYHQALTADRDNKYLMLDRAIVRAQQAASGKGGARIRRWGVPEAD